MRLIYRVRYGRRLGGWVVVLPSKKEGPTYVRKDIAVLEARKEARGQWTAFRRLSQLVIHLKNGRIQTEHTYGRDPRRSRG